jgi:allophanate hydrolase subunit 2
MSDAWLEVTSAAGLITVQDGGRPGRMHEGIPPGGAFVPERLAAANAAVGNAPDAAAFEIFGKLGVRAGGVATNPTYVSLDGAPGVTLAADASFDVPAAPDVRVRYLAVAGGLDVPVVLDGRGTLLVAAFGGHEGRALRRGDRLPIGAASRLPRQAHPHDAALAATLHVVPGPDDECFAPGALAALVAAPLAIAPLGDRVGVRLAGPDAPPWRPLAAATARSAPMIRGAIQVTPSGELLVLGPDHPTTGGYPVIAVIVRTDVGRLLVRRPGAPVRLGYAD